MLKNLFSNNFFSIWSPWFFGSHLKKNQTWIYSKWNSFLFSESAALTNWKKMCQGNPSLINQVYSWKYLCHHSLVLCQQQKMFTRNTFISTCLQNKNILFSVWVFTNFNSKFLLCENLASFSTFTETAN